MCIPAKQKKSGREQAKSEDCACCDSGSKRKCICSRPAISHYEESVIKARKLEFKAMDVSATYAPC